MLQLLSIADASTMTGSSRLSCPGIVSGTTWCSIGQRREKGRVQQGGARHCRISVKIRRLLRKNTRTWVLSSVAKFVYCVQTVCTLAKLGFPSFHIVCRCVFASFDSSTFWLLSFSALFAVLWFCLLCFTTGYCIHCQKAICVFRVHFRKTE